MATKIVFADGTTFQQSEQAKAVVSPLKTGRDWRQIAVVGTVDAVKTAFIDNASYYQAWDSIETVIDPETEEETTQTVEHTRDLSEWSVAGEVVDHRDGTCTVLMGKPTEVELLQAQIAAMPDYDDLAGIIREGVNNIDE